MLTMLKEATQASYPFLGFLLLREAGAWAACGIFRFSDRACAALSFTYVVNLEIGNLLKWVIFNIVSGQATGDALWK